MSARARLASFALAVVLLAGLVAWAGRTTWHDLQQLRGSYEKVESDAFHLSEYIEASTRNLHETVLRFDSLKNDADRAKFISKGRELKKRIGAHKADLASPSVGALTRQIDVAFEVYLSRSITLMDEMAKAGTV
ncbi:MAG: hypothetical protein WCT12_13745, partial [Verrucomicrobiota bacterium]